MDHRDLSDIQQGKPLTSLGSISAHTRPVEALDGHSLSPTSAVLCTGDTMGVVKYWDLQKEDGVTPARWKASLRGEYTNHRTKINELVSSPTQIWTGRPPSLFMRNMTVHHVLTASADDTVQSVSDFLGPETPAQKIRSITHLAPVRCVLPLALTDLGEPYVLTGAGDKIRVYDVSSPDEPELLREIDSHWHDVTALRLWLRKSQTADGSTTAEPWIVSTSLDGTIRRWRLLGAFCVKYILVYLRDVAENHFERSLDSRGDIDRQD